MTLPDVWLSGLQVSLVIFILWASWSVSDSKRNIFPWANFFLFIEGILIIAYNEGYDDPSTERTWLPLAVASVTIPCFVFAFAVLQYSNSTKTPSV